MGQGSSKGYHYIIFPKKGHSWSLDQLNAGITVLLGYSPRPMNASNRGFHWWHIGVSGLPIMPVIIEERDCYTSVGVYNKLKDPSIIQTIRHWHDHGYFDIPDLNRPGG